MKNHNHAGWVSVFVDDAEKIVADPDKTETRWSMDLQIRDEHDCLVAVLYLTEDSARAIVEKITAELVSAAVSVTP